MKFTVMTKLQREERGRVRAGGEQRRQKRTHVLYGSSSVKFSCTSQGCQYCNGSMRRSGARDRGARHFFVECVAGRAVLRHENGKQARHNHLTRSSIKPKIGQHYRGAGTLNRSEMSVPHIVSFCMKLLFGSGLPSLVSSVLVVSVAGAICLPRMRRDMIVCTAPDQAYMIKCYTLHRGSKGCTTYLAANSLLPDDTPRDGCSHCTVFSSLLP